MRRSSNESSTDREKRGKILLLAAFIALSLFVSKLFQKDTQVVISRVYLNALIYFVIVFVGLIWAFNFQIKRKSLIYLLQPALFVFSQELFIEFFFFQKFSRIYEAFILLLLVIVVFFVNYFAFLSANVFNVNLYKKIPLAQVARTSSYVISVLTMYFLTFSFLLSEFNVYFLLGSILPFYIIVALIHYINVEVEEGELLRKSFLTAFISFVLLAGVFLSGNVHEVISITPVVGYYFAVSMVTQESMIRGKYRGIGLHVFALIITFVAVLLTNIFNR